jgi:voltage-gated potassium channel
MSGRRELAVGDRLADRLLSKPLTARRAARAIALFTLFVTVTGGVLAWLLDRDDFPSLGSAIWWAVQTVTTVGYGDVVPRNAEGRVIAGIVMIAGIGFVTIITAAIAAAFIEGARERRGVDRTVAQLEEVLARLERLEKAFSRDRPQRPD